LEHQVFSNKGFFMTEIAPQPAVPREWSDIGLENYLRLNSLVDNQLRLTGRGCSGVLVDMVSGKFAKVKQEIDDISQLSGINNKEYTQTGINSAILISLGCKTPDEIDGKILEAQTRGLNGRPSTGSEIRDRQMDNLVRLTKMVAVKSLNKRLSLIKK
jgi:hypothetical protein